ncbi:MAG TPA: outer membrane beta-barrel protein [Ferruginibacter sp.]|jgi:hypothetical protein|nr:outer membrane beta-barrel protein [Ferruginibacter sp.]
MKKIATLLLATTITIAASAQVYLQGGLNLANISTANNGQTQNSNTLATFNAGFMGRFGISDIFDLEAGALFTGKGSKSETDYSGGTYVKSTFNPYYVEIPLNAVIKIPLGDPKITKANIFLFAGPYAAIGVAGRARTTSNVPGYTESSSNIKFDNEDPFTSDQDNASYDKLKLWDFGFNFGGGFDFGPVLIKANYGLGMTKINSTESDNDANDKNKYRTVSISLGIKLD